MRFTLAAVLALASAALAQSSSSASGASATGKSASIPASESASSTLTDSAAQASASAAAVLTPCVLGCLAAAAKDTECQLPTNVTCACTNADFQFKSTSCLQAECQASELKGAVGLQQQQCGALSLSATASPSATAPFMPSNPAADISSTPSATGSGSSPSGSGGAGGSGKTGAATALWSGSSIVYAALVAVVGGVVGAVVV